MTRFVKYYIWRKAKRNLSQEHYQNSPDNASPESSDADNFPQEEFNFGIVNDGPNQDHHNDDNLDHNSDNDGLDHQPPLDPDDDPSENGDNVIFEGDEEPDDTSLSLQEVIAKWTISENIRKSKINSLLHLLFKNDHLRKKIRAKTLLGTPKPIKTENISDLETHTYNVSQVVSTLIKRLEKFTGRIHHDVYLIYNIDGIPLAKSSNYQFWPLLCRSV